MLNLLKKYLLKYVYQLLICYLLIVSYTVTAQQSKIIIERSDFVDINENEVPGAVLLTGNVSILHEGVKMTCNKAYHFSAKNFIKTFGDVVLTQGDTIVMTSSYGEYNGNKRIALAKGNVTLKDPSMTLVTDSLKFDRNQQEAYYETNGTIYEKDNILKSKKGTYYLKDKKYQFLTTVTLTNPKYVIKTDHLDYYTYTGDSYLLGPSTITGKDNFIYTERGTYNTKSNQAKLVDKSYIKYNNQRIQGDSIYYDRTRDFSSATKNIRITDSINKSLIKGDYAEVYRKKDSLYITKKAVIINQVENDSIYIHAKQFVVTGKAKNRIIRGYHNVRIFKTDMSGKCDSIHSTESQGLTKMIGRPVVWNENNQLTGKVIHLIADKETKQLDSLKIINDAFLIQKDTLGSGFNQVKGVYLNSKIKEKKMHEVDVLKNAEVIFYMRDENDELTGINKSLSTKINVIFENNKVETLTFFKQVDGDIYPEKDLPENSRKLRGFEWRDQERIKDLSELFLEN